MNSEFQPSIVAISDTTRATNALDANLVPLRAHHVPDDDEVPFRKTKAGKIVIGVVVTATLITALGVFLGVWLGLRLRNRQQSSSSCPSLPSCPSTANVTTTPEFMGGTAFALQTNAGDTRIYYQNADGSLHVRSGVGPVTAGGSYSDTLIIAPGMARINTPLAAISWSPENFDQVNLPQ